MSSSSCYSHVITAIYWATLDDKPRVFEAEKLNENVVVKYGRIITPYIPIMLPILLFCRHTELKLRLRSCLDLNDISKLEMWNSLMEEKMLVRNTANDIKIIGRLD